MNKKQSETMWRDALRQVDGLTDRLGMPVDEEIKETVAIMRLMGIHTTMSCAGHLKRITGGPYIMFVSPEADELRKEVVAIGDPTNPERRKLYDKANRINLMEQQKIYFALEKFYASRKVAFGQMITLRTMGYSGSRLYCQGAELAHISNEDMQKKILHNNRDEMRAFTEYLKASYFATNS